MTNFYTSGMYSKINPKWDTEDSYFKYTKIKEIILKNNINFKDICEVGCGAAEILSQFKNEFKNTNVYGYDIAHGLDKFWKEKKDINLFNSNFLKTNNKKYDLIIFADVIEHLDSPFDYLDYSRKVSDYIVIYLPLDLSLRSLLNTKLLKKQIFNVGHINFYTKDIFMNILRHKNFKVLDCNFNHPFRRKINQSNLKSIFIQKLRIFFSLFFSNNFYSLLFGGETITILIKS